tara:strand:- start:150 stop:494 length:345 start_codon:yes stop_codon:yes gene_type:complete
MSKKKKATKKKEKSQFTVWEETDARRDTPGQRVDDSPQDMGKGMKKEEMVLEIVDEWLYQAKHDTLRAYAFDRYTNELRKLSKKEVAEKYDAMVSDKTRMERKTWMTRKPMRRW